MCLLLASSLYQTEGAIFSPQQVGQQARQGGLIPPAPAGCVEVGGDGQVDVWQKAREETQSQRHKNMQRQLLSRLFRKHKFLIFFNLQYVAIILSQNLILTRTLKYFLVH